ncbi:hypothetical protein M2132_000901 [Dysgonomonas sp. PH5-45]|uniref:leucine-rich repeat domain-containing protein n=1 Tax=unclassified Dysgonomonas TaxID=2630389 RepID=UPI002474B4F8|nr:MULTISPECIES: leucine-rich repeat domain-containing protein [unclassified Dysgonomonas]MDH6354573.1 hypothetical protein [Dysgonomonas sp. PH5-45]MDH6387371.1 hypothetical protein [Dysgonomonas sp. PH5-37]
MMKNLLLKPSLVIIGLLLQISLWAQTPTILHVETAGTLPSLIAEDDKYKITELTLSGELNGTDIRYIRAMTGRNAQGGSTDGKLAMLDISEANIVSGGDNFSNSYTTSNNSISDFMFGKCTELTKIVIPKTVTYIGNSAFYGCEKLTNIEIPDNVTGIGGYAFYECESLTNIDIPNSVTYIGIYAFEGCSSLTDVTIGNGITEIKGWVFLRCTNLTNITIPDNVTSIGCAAFYKCESLTNIDIPNSVTHIESSAFEECFGLTNVTIGNGITTINISSFADCTGLTNIIIPDNVVSIRGVAFDACSSLTSVTIGNSVNFIETAAFRNCTELAEIYCKSIDPATIESGTFLGVDKKTCKLYVPKGSFDTYRKAPYWSEFKNIIEEGASSISAINENNITIQSTSEGITIEAKEQVNVSVYNLSGHTVYQSVISGYTEIPLTKGVYIVKTNDEKQKIIVQ